MGEVNNSTKVQTSFYAFNSNCNSKDFFCPKKKTVKKENLFRFLSQRLTFEATRWKQMRDKEKSRVWGDFLCLASFFVCFVCYLSSNISTCLALSGKRWPLSTRRWSLSRRRATLSSQRSTWGMKRVSGTLARLVNQSFLSRVGGKKCCILNGCFCNLFVSSRHDRTAPGAWERRLCKRRSCWGGRDHQR